MKERKKIFDTVKFFQKVKEKIARETKGMAFIEFKVYLEEHKLKQ